LLQNVILNNEALETIKPIRRSSCLIVTFIDIFTSFGGKIKTLIERLYVKESYSNFIGPQTVEILTKFLVYNFVLRENGMDVT